MTAPRSTGRGRCLVETLRVLALKAAVFELSGGDESLRAGVAREWRTLVTSKLPVPSAGPKPIRPSYRTETAPPHTPQRPMWVCPSCGQSWPCAEARLLLKVEYESALPALSIYLSGLMYEAMRDLAHLNPHDGPSPREMFERFVAWVPFRRSIVEGR